MVRLLEDLRHAVRALIRRPLFAFVAVLSLAVVMPATIVPARRATTVQPIEALRAE